MSFEITCKLKKVLEPQKGTSNRGEWVKQVFVTETVETYPKEIAFTAFNEPVNQLRAIQAGSTIKVQFRVESREYQGKYYSDIKAFNITPVMVSNDAQPIATAAPTNFTTNLNVPSVEASQTQAVEDDLPF